MTYATQQGRINFFGTVEITELSDRDNTGAINAAIVGQALTMRTR
jgi:phage gp36-like protein